MPKLPARPDFAQLRRQAKDLHRRAMAGDPDAQQREGGSRPTLALAQLHIARDYGFLSWTQLKSEVARRTMLDTGDAAGLRALIAEQPELAVTEMQNWCDHQDSAAPLSYVAMLRYDTANSRWREVPGTGELARLLLAAGAPVDGHPGDDETPLITAASYGDAEVARVLIAAGAALEAKSSDEGGGVPNATALRHAAVFGTTDVLDILLDAGARIGSLTQAAAAGNLTGWLTEATPPEDRVLALCMAADHQRLAVIDELLSVGVPIDAEDEKWGRQALRVAASNARVHSVRHLLARGADPTHVDPEHGMTALQWCRRSRSAYADSTGHNAVEALLIASTPTPA